MTKKNGQGSGSEETEDEVGSQARTQWLESGGECGHLVV